MVLHLPRPRRAYSLDLARPKRVPTLAQKWALDRAMAARQTCPEFSRRYWFCLKRPALRWRPAVLPQSGSDGLSWPHPDGLKWPYLDGDLPAFDNCR